MKKKLLIVGIILLIISFVLWFVFFDNEVNSKSINNTTIDDNKINDTLTDEELDNNDKVEDDDSLNDEDKPVDESKENNDNDQNNNSQEADENINGSTQKPENDTDGSTQKPDDDADISKPEVILSELEQVVLDIKNDYGVDVLYHNDAYVTVNGVSGTKTTVSDEEVILKNVQSIYTNLSYIPDVLINSMLSNGGYYIMMMKEIPGNNDGYAVRSWVYGDYHIVIELDNSGIDKIFYHETWHLIESDMRKKNSNIFNGWENMNPVGFSYGTFENEYIPYSDTTKIDEIAFVSSYAKTNAEEDRCELFADLMFRTRKYTYMNVGYGIKEKAIHLSNLIDQVYGDINNARWDRWISF